MFVCWWSEGRRLEKQIGEVRKVLKEIGGGGGYLTAKITTVS